jgi:hypothetical protein
MSETYESVLEAALRLPPKLLRQLAKHLSIYAGERASRPPTEDRGVARRHFGAWDSGDEGSADNERIDLELSREYEDSHTP